MKQVLNFYSPENGDNSITLTDGVHGEVLRNLSSATETLFKTWVVKAIKDFVYIRNVNTPEYEKGLAKNDAFKRKVISLLSNLGKNADEITTYNFTPSEYMNIKYTIPAEDNSIIQIEIRGFEGDYGKLKYQEKGFTLYITQKSIEKRLLKSYNDENINIKRELITEVDIDIFKSVYEYIYVIALSEFIYHKGEAYIDYMTKNLAKFADIQAKRKILIDKYGLKIRGVEDED
nr:MAG TPA: hypothetical protein [Caudoviricetes sp.]